MPLHAMAHLLSTSATFQTGMDQLRMDLAAQHAIQEARELAQHANCEAREDHCNAMQTFKGHFGMVKLEEILHLLDLTSQDDLPELLHSLGRNKKKSRCEIHGIESIVQGTTDMICCGCGGDMQVECKF